MLNLKVTRSKCVVMVVGKAPEPITATLKEEVLQTVLLFTLIGSALTHGVRINIKHNKQGLKSILIYSSETYVVSKRNSSRLQVVEMKFLKLPLR